MKKICKFIIFLLILHINITSSFAEPAVQYSYFNVGGINKQLPIADIDFNGEKITYANAGVDPVIINNRTLVPVRFLSEKMNYKVTWEKSEEKVTIDNGQKKIELFIGKNIAIINGNTQQMTDSTPPIIINNKTMVPIRFVVEQFGIEIDYDSVMNKVTLDTFSLDAPVFKDDKNVESKEKDTNTNTSEKVPLGLPRITYKIVDDDSQIFEITSESSDIEFKHFYMENPARLVMDINASVLDSSLNEKMNFENNIFKSINIGYHEDGNYLRIVLEMRNIADKKYIEVIKNQNKVNIYLTNEIKKRNFAFDFERLTGNIIFKLEENYDVSNLSTNEINLVIPKEKANLPVGTIISENNFLKNLNITKDNDNYYISSDIKERTHFSMEKLDNLSYKISFNKDVSHPPIVVLDAGHGGKDPGAQNKKFNANEKDLNLQVMQKLYATLQSRGYEVYATRNEDVFLELNDIAKIANEHNPDIFISIHHNAFAEKPSVNGIETYYHQSKDSKKLGDFIQKNMIISTNASNRGVKTQPYVVIKKTYMPAVLLELGFITNEEEVQKNMNQDYQNILATSIANGIDEYFMNR